MTWGLFVGGPCHGQWRDVADSCQAVEAWDGGADGKKVTYLRRRVAAPVIGTDPVLGRREWQAKERDFWPLATMSNNQAFDALRELLLVRFVTREKEPDV